MGDGFRWSEKGIARERTLTEHHVAIQF